VFATGVAVKLFLTDVYDKRKITCIVSCVIAALFLALVFINGGRWEEKYNSPDYIEIKVNSKESTIQQSYSTQYKTVISFTIRNNCLKDIKHIEGRMVFYDGDEEIGASEVSFTSTINSDGSSKMTVEFIGSDEVYQCLYSTPFDSLRIKYKITSVRFENFDIKTFDDGYKTIKTVSRDKQQGWPK
jgi:hypothetical protein